ncbi:hypothetical protein MAR_016078 [Mya arenaria]|uniref:Uncharacterized protein n=1 Tax=Mya arenaria TaxID=6604 RepID=A0ABY7FLQ9_MYAAR|nr:hypothetical protein MAR_016078 [Mya arenaria]
MKQPMIQTPAIVMPEKQRQEKKSLGHELHKKELEKAEQEKLHAMRVAEQAVWEEAEKLKVIALEKAKEEAAIEQERVIKKLKKQQAKALLEEALKVEMAMQKLAIEQVKQERAEGEQRLKKAVKETEQRENQKKYDIAIKKAQNEKDQALKELRDSKDLDRAKAVQEAESRERRIATEKILSLTRQYEAVIEELRTEITKREEEIKRIISEKAQTEKQKVHVENCLVDTRKDFQDFIDNLPAYDKMQADFLLPRVYLDELESKGYSITMLRLPVTKTVKKKKSQASK